MPNIDKPAKADKKALRNAEVLIKTMRELIAIEHATPEMALQAVIAAQAHNDSVAMLSAIKAQTKALEGINNHASMLTMNI